MEALNVAVVMEPAPGDQTNTDFITQQINDEIEKEEQNLDAQDEIAFDPEQITDEQPHQKPVEIGGSIQ